jgi:predicted nucleotidyltransferase
MHSRIANMTSLSTTSDAARLEQRRQAAIAVAERCKQVLTQEFGATEVIVFGSLRGDAPWHWQSDLDLAVRGLSDAEILAAYERLEAIVPVDLPFDLVDVERVNPRVKTRILQEEAMAENKYLALKTRIEDELSLIEQTIAALHSALEQSDTVPELFVLPTLAGYITDFYSGCERISERVAVTLDGGLPQTADWHRQLLRQLAEPTESRPELWNGGILLDLNDYRAFRHINRHRYQLELQRDRIFELAHQVQPVFAQVQVAVARFTQWLEQQER